MDAGLGFSLFWFQPEFRTQSTWIAYQKVLVGLECAIEGAELEKTQDEYRRERERERESHQHLQHATARPSSDMPVLPRRAKMSSKKSQAADAEGRDGPPRRGWWQSGRALCIPKRVHRPWLNKLQGVRDRYQPRTAYYKSRTKLDESCSVQVYTHNTYYMIWSNVQVCHISHRITVHL